MIAWFGVQRVHVLVARPERWGLGLSLGQGLAGVP
jgi:hypothetical protein